MPVTILLTDLTSGAVTGTGIFDKLMASTKAHLEAEYTKGRIKGPEYATVYLGALDNVMSNSMQFLLQKAAIGLQADLLAQQILLAGIEVQKAAIALEILAIEKLKVSAEKLQIEAQTALIVQQTESEALRNFIHPTDPTLSGTIEKERQVLIAQECKLRAEFDLTVNNNLKITSEIALLAQKAATERAQILAMGVDADSVVGKQKILYQAQTDGFKRDAEQKVASLLIGSWNTRRTTDEATVADGVNMLNDVAIGRTVTKLLAGVGA